MIWNPFEANKRIEELEGAVNYAKSTARYWEDEHVRKSLKVASLEHKLSTTIPTPKRDARGRFCK